MLILGRPWSALGSASRGGWRPRPRTMTDALSHTLEQRWQEILRRTALALQGRGVGVWEVAARGRPQLLAASSADDVSPLAADELEATLREVGELPASGRPPRRWVASRLERQRWCIAPVRSDPPLPPPTGVERRGPERLLLELAGVCIGLIERQLSEQPLEQFKAIVESADDAVIGKTLDGVITTWNPAAARLYGYSAEEVIGKPIALLAPPDYIDEIPALLERLARGERIEHYETTRVRKDGARIEVSISISPILDAQRRPVGATAIAYDVTARRHAEQQLVHGALHDALTDLPNRAYFVERVSQAQDLLRDADLAMYHAKQLGRARYQVFDAALRDSAQARFGMEADLRNALERRELRLVFQPIVELQTGRVRGFEALLRWHRPKRGVMLPPEFVPLAEQTGLIVPIGTWVLQEACRQARRWQDAFPAAGPVGISVNLSGRQLAHASLVDEVRTAFQEAGLPPACLVLEISESVLMDSAEPSTDVLHQLRALKVGLNIDAFGTGHSSLGSLPRFPLHGIKIDRAFVHRMGSRRTDLEIVRSIVELAGNLGLGVIAECVETVTQRARLIAFGCELGQGHLFAKPLEAQAAGALLAGPEEPGRRIA